MVLDASTSQLAYRWWQSVSPAKKTESTAIKSGWTVRNMAQDYSWRSRNSRGDQAIIMSRMAEDVARWIDQARSEHLGGGHTDLRPEGGLEVRDALDAVEDDASGQQLDHRRQSEERADVCLE
jgi:hypothetical protein